MARVLRRMVSTNKCRIRAEDGSIDIDASWVLPGRLLALGYPASGARSVLRNPLHEVRAFLCSCGSPQHWLVFNLCIEPGWQYEAASLLPGGLLPGCVVNMPLWDAQAPPCHLMHAFCEDAAGWLAAHPQHKVAVHCKAGKGRTGALISALLLYMVKHWEAGALPPELVTGLTRADGSQISISVPALQLVGPALRFWGQQRTLDGKGLTISSQRRYVSYYAAQLDAGSPCPKHEQQRHGQCRLHAIALHGLSRRAGTAACLAWRTSAASCGSPAGRWVVPDVTIAVWLRAPGEHTPRLLAYGCTSAAAANKPALPLTVGNDTGDIQLSLEHVVGVGSPAEPPGDGGVLVAGDVKLQVLRGVTSQALTSEHALFKGRRSVCYAWLSTRYLATHAHHAPHAVRPGVQPVVHPTSALCEDGSGRQRVVLGAGELDKLQKKLRGSPRVGLSITFTPTTDP